MKFKTEQEFCIHVTEIFLGLSVTAGRKLIAIPEVPWGYYSNNQLDMLLLDTKNMDYLPIEFKLNGLGSLKRQMQRIRGIGIINTDTNDSSCNLFGYTGKDSQVGKIAHDLFNYKYAHHRWKSIYTGDGLVYWWAYKNNESCLNGGMTGGSRESMATVYERAIRNLHAEYGKLDFMLTHSALRSQYSVSGSKRIYRQVTKG